MVISLGQTDGPTLLTLHCRGNDRPTLSSLTSPQKALLSNQAELGITQTYTLHSAPERGRRGQYQRGVGGGQTGSRRRQYQRGAGGGSTREEQEEAVPERSRRRQYQRGAGGGSTREEQEEAVPERSRRGQYQRGAGGGSTREEQEEAVPEE
uniref:Uncharacterized protein n=1 Tax=Knipowitschia caucasica TaxID=637954 RepID=A0AAV2JT25_KNICA